MSRNLMKLKEKTIYKKKIKITTHNNNSIIYLAVARFNMNKQLNLMQLFINRIIKELLTLQLINLKFNLYQAQILKKTYCFRIKEPEKVVFKLQANKLLINKFQSQ
jgi:hypothetical protein